MDANESGLVKFDAKNWRQQETRSNRFFNFCSFLFPYSGSPHIQSPSTIFRVDFELLISPSDPDILLVFLFCLYSYSFLDVLASLYRSQSHKLLSSKPQLVSNTIQSLRKCAIFFSFQFLLIWHFAFRIEEKKIYMNLCCYWRQLSNATIFALFSLRRLLPVLVHFSFGSSEPKKKKIDFHV